MKQIIMTAFFVVNWSGLLPVECFGVEIPLNEIINEQHFQDKIEPGALRDGNLALSDFAYDLASVPIERGATLLPGSITVRSCSIRDFLVGHFGFL
jgi:hypothetical protein